MCISLVSLKLMRVALKPMHVRAFSKDNIFVSTVHYSTFTIVLIVLYFESKTESKYCYSNYLFSQCTFNTVKNNYLNFGVIFRMKKKNNKNKFYFN